MQFLDLTLPTPAENLALDEALLDEAEAADGPREVLRLWEADRPMVVVGRSSQVEREVHVERCQQLGVPVVRRASGGASIVAGPGCLMYALVLSYEHRPALRRVDEAHRYVLSTIASALGRLGLEVRCQGISDLTLGEKKFSGNSARAKRTHLVYHGTLLYDFPIELISRLLLSPPRTPDYRAGRLHEAFVTNLPLAPAVIRAGLSAAFEVDRRLCDWPSERTATLVADRYGRDEWHQQW